MSEDDLLFPRPDFMVGLGCMCDSLSKSGAVMAEKLGLPFFLLDAPRGLKITPEGEQVVEQEYIEYYADQYHELASFLEGLTGRPLDEDKLAETCRQANRALDLWEEISQLRRISPCPMGALDEAVSLFVPMALLGTEEAVEFLESVKEEVQERVARGQGVVEVERRRLLILGGPAWWYDLGLFNAFEELGAVPVKHELDVGWAAGRLDPADPARSWAERLIRNYGTIDLLSARIAHVRRLIADYRADGLVIFSHWGCRVLSGQNLAIKETIYRELGLPTLILDGDLADDRHRASRQQDQDKIEQFVEMLD